MCNNLNDIIVFFQQVLSPDALERLIHDFGTARLDHCNSITLVWNLRGFCLAKLSSALGIQGGGGGQGAPDHDSRGKITAFHISRGK